MVGIAATAAACDGGGDVLEPGPLRPRASMAETATATTMTPRRTTPPIVATAPRADRVGRPDMRPSYRPERKATMARSSAPSRARNWTDGMPPG